MANDAISETVRGLFRRDPTTRGASVQFWVVAATALLLLKFAVGSIGPRFMISARHVKPGVQLLRILCHYSVSYILGLMGGSTANDLFKVWAVLISTMQDSISIGRPYKPKEMTMVDLLTSLWSANQLRGQMALYLKAPLWLIWSIHASRVIWYYVSSESVTGVGVENMKLVSDYMASSQHTADDACPATMAGYKYLVHGEDQQGKEIEESTFRLKLDEARPEKLITLEKVWSHRDSGDRLLGRDADGDSRFKDVCLSFALYKLLRRRCFDFPMPEAKHAASRRLVSDGILNDGHANAYERAFRVTEVELSFLQDFCYSKHAVVFAGGFPTLRLLLSLSMTGAASYLAYAVCDIPKTTTAVTAHGHVAKITHGVFITRCIILIIICRELWEMCVYVLSQWTKVLIICHYVRLRQQRPGWVSMLHRRVTETVGRIMFWIISRGRWDQEIRQYNLLMAARDGNRKRSLLLRIWRPSPIYAFKLPSEVKKKIFESLKEVSNSAFSAKEDGNDTSGCLAQRRNNELLKSHYRSAFAVDTSKSLPPSIEAIVDGLEGYTHKILAWHVATNLCQMKLIMENPPHRGDLYALTPPPLGSGGGLAAAVWAHYMTAVSLSNYCAYLVTEALVPDNGLVVSKVLNAVRREARDAVRGSGTEKEVYNTLVEDAWEGDATPGGPSIVKIGARLSLALTEGYDRGRDADQLWECLAKFWTGFLLDLSASTRVAKHQIHLQGRGELTTHLWALLSHAGFLGETSHGHQLLDLVDLDAA